MGKTKQPSLFEAMGMGDQVSNIANYLCVVESKDNDSTTIEVKAGSRRDAVVEATKAVNKKFPKKDYVVTEVKIDHKEMFKIADVNNDNVEDNYNKYTTKG